MDRLPCSSPPFPLPLAPREVLLRFGNMSSGSVLFVLDSIRREAEKAKQSSPPSGSAGSGGQLEGVSGEVKGKATAVSGDGSGLAAGSTQAASGLPVSVSAADGASSLAPACEPAAVPEWGVALGFGPGVTIEGCLLRLLV